MFVIDFNLIDYISEAKMIPTHGSNDYDEKLWNTHMKSVFRLKDDDDEIYYYGRLLCDKGHMNKLLDPLDEFGTPVGGCTSIEYYDDDTDEWSRI